VLIRCTLNWKPSRNKKKQLLKLKAERCYEEILPQLERCSVLANPAEWWHGSLADDPPPDYEGNVEETWKLLKRRMRTTGQVLLCASGLAAVVCVLINLTCCVPVRATVWVLLCACASCCVGAAVCLCELLCGCCCVLPGLSCVGAAVCCRR
jgi:hypothetical protein